MNRLLDMGVEDYLLTSTVIGVARAASCALCPHCRSRRGAAGSWSRCAGSIRRREGDHALPADRLRAVRPDRATRAGSASEMLPITDPLRSR
jgi:type II secretory ATPase GspE/PulE/Tfp pilus assembly ATPase PilB-like protein